MTSKLNVSSIDEQQDMKSSNASSINHSSGGNVTLTLAKESLI